MDAPVVPPEYQQIKVNIVDVEFQGEISLSDEERSQLVTVIQRSNMTVGPNGPDIYWANDAAVLAIEFPFDRLFVSQRLRTPSCFGA